MNSETMPFSWPLACSLANYAELAYARATIKDCRTNAQALVTLNEDGDLIIAFKGSTTPRDFLQDAKLIMRPLDWTGNFSFAEAHAGFLEDFMAIADATANEVKSSLTAHNPERIYVTGHSLGGALAILGALEFQRQKLPVTGVYTFGQPRVGNACFRALYDSELRTVTYRVVNQNDIVPRIPGWLQGYRHCGQEMFLLVGGGWCLNPCPARKLLSDASGLYVAYRNRDEVLISDHYMKSYCQAMSLLRDPAAPNPIGQEPETGYQRQRATLNRET
ncbi:MAG: lipase family protein [Verrucomicrobiota bacterium]